MTLLQNMLQQNLTEADDLTRLPKKVMSAIKSNIRKGAEDLSQKWANALELVHKAYQVEGVERPDPTMKTAWEQYEQNIAYAVQQLADNRGMDGDWRMSSSMFHEARKIPIKYKVQMGETTSIVEAVEMDEIINNIKKQTLFDVNVTKSSNSEATLSFSRWGIKKNSTVKINKL